MLPLGQWPYREIWHADFEFEAGTGERPVPVCLCARELRSGREIRLWRDEFGPAPPYPIDADSLFVAYYSSAEFGCHCALGWLMPARILDLFTEFRCGTNGLTVPAGNGLIGALTAFGLDTMGATEKKELQTAIGNGTWPGRYTPEEILDYCMSDVDALARLLPVMAPRIDLPRALLRGRYMAHGIRRHPDRHADAGEAAALLGADPRPADRAHRCRLRRLRRAYFQRREVRSLSSSRRHSLAQA
jgi:DNA polymerase I